MEVIGRCCRLGTSIGNFAALHELQTTASSIKYLITRSSSRMNDNIALCASPQCQFKQSFSYKSLPIPHLTVNANNINNHIQLPLESNKINLDEKSNVVKNTRTLHSDDWSSTMYVSMSSLIIGSRYGMRPEKRSTPFVPCDSHLAGSTNSMMHIQSRNLHQFRHNSVETHNRGLVDLWGVCHASTTTTRDKLRNKIRNKLPELKEEELEERFVRGSGPGGQSTNKTSNCVVLKHIPTGIVVKCHQTRSQSENQRIARLLLRERLDQHHHGSQSALAQLQQASQKKRDEKKRKTRLKLERLRELRSGGEEGDPSAEPKDR